ncbi:YrhK family protein [Fodinicurvata halophila]|uniref:YrhK family protein n=1 Tax=Fodinicurvata halophila TaxID=1419723 RepID=A0ABV8UNC3_9PROT
MTERLNGFQRELDVELEKLRQFYFWIHLTADMGCGICFVVGSVFFFYQSLLYDGTWLFLIGSILFAAKPFIRLFHELHRRHRIHLSQVAEKS